METEGGGVPRRQVLKGAATAGVALGTLPLTGLRAQGTGKKLKVALVGCGGRGSGAIENHMDAVKVINDKLSLGLEVTPVATADFSKGNAENVGKRWGVAADKCFGGPTAYQKAIEAGPDMVLFATPTCFRPVHFAAAIAAGKSVFMEKPVAVDPPGIRKVLGAYEDAKKKGLTVVAGTQRRHSHGYNERWQAIREGLFGRILGGRVSWCMGKFFGEKPINPSKPEDLIGQGKWWCWNMISGDHIVEQHVHNVDIANWYLQSHPLSARGFGFRARRVGGNMYDFFSVDFEYPNGVHIHSMCRQMGGCWDWVGEEFTYEKGGGKPKEPVPYSDLPRKNNDYVDEHVHLILSVLKEKVKEPINEAQNVAWATGANILAREAAYSGQQITWGDMFEKQGTPWHDLRRKPYAEDFETGDIVYPKDGDIQIPGKA
jgi:predicted dehydrogenase